MIVYSFIPPIPSTQSLHPLPYTWVYTRSHFAHSFSHHINTHRHAHTNHQLLHTARAPHSISTLCVIKKHIGEIIYHYLTNTLTKITIFFPIPCFCPTNSILLKKQYHSLFPFYKGTYLRCSESYKFSKYVMTMKYANSMWMTQMFPKIHF